MKKRFDVPILLIIFNRPETTREVFEKIRIIKPKVLYIAADGPRKNRESDTIKCNEAREVTEKIDWKCHIKRLYRKDNLGCGRAVSGALNWFFKNVENGIILEDDCLADESFFEFSETMLQKYKKYADVMHISGDNFFDQSQKNKNSYLMSSYPHVWGWATWRRAWNKYDFKIKKWSGKNLIQKIKSIRGNLWNKFYWTAMFDSVLYKANDTWDFQWVYAMMENNGLSIFPGVNLVTNIGFGASSTHTSSATSYLANLKRFSLNDDVSLNNRMNVHQVDLLEQKSVFKVKSLKTIIYFLYFSIICKLINYAKK